ncbi:hypothetical protein [Roseomonas sp. 18066]|uniref:Y-family DNA polymerase n=1 Tax=Roseomonas sp. 18066 TaxID=2681412 RepID=UPI001F230F0F|nr:hypothetical protein [Roseomonas sp. 18066]
MPSTYGLIDGNSFYCSAERAFAPVLRGVAVVVLSNNDGCAIARTAEAKALGIKMGDPWHLIRERRELRDVRWFSSNYPLYGDMSRRVYQVLAERLPRVEPYSIDEMFLDLDVPGDLRRLCQELREVVRASPRSRPAWAGARPRPSPSWPTASPRTIPSWRACAT